MTRSENPLSHWKITLRDLIAVVTCLCVSLSLFFGSSAIPDEQLYLSTISNLLTLFMLGGSIGVLGWRLWYGIHARTWDGFWGGGCLLLVILWVLSPLLILVFSGF